MPFRSITSRGATCLRFPLARPFHSSSILRDNHYDTLKIATNATAKEIKSSFYKLSKLSHPDRNPNDPHAAKRFLKISEAYTILRHPDKRHSYDRDVLNLHKPPVAHHPGGSHFSGPAGGRPASGLSRRRTQFRGPPPSFYRSGGWGEHSEKRKAAQDGQFKADAAANASAAPGGAGMGYGQAPHGHERNIPHFDRESHMRTHDNHEKRKKSKVKGTVMEHAMPSGTMFGSFMLLTGLIGTFIVGPWWLFDYNGKKSISADLNKRDRERARKDRGEKVVNAEE